LSCAASQAGGSLPCVPETDAGGVVDSEEMRWGARVKGPRGWEGGVPVVLVDVGDVVDEEGVRRRRVELWKVRLRRWSWGHRRIRRA
jgi:hypothetical protein